MSVPVSVCRWGGDTTKVSLCGQSAGAQLAFTVLFEQAKLHSGVRSGDEPPDFAGTPRWPVRDLHLAFGLSGPYDMLRMREHLHHRGIHRSVTSKVFGGGAALRYYSPELQAQQKYFPAIAKELPPLFLFHGLSDMTVSHLSTVRFAQRLQSHGAAVQTRYFEAMTHSGPLVEDLMHNKMVEEDWVHELRRVLRHRDMRHGHEVRRTKKYVASTTFVPRWRMRAARYINPF